jgi:hypothetical protein
MMVTDWSILRIVRIVQNPKRKQLQRKNQLQHPKQHPKRKRLMLLAVHLLPLVALSSLL